MKVTKGVILRGKDSGFRAYMEYVSKEDLPLSQWEKDYHIVFVRYEED